MKATGIDHIEVFTATKASERKELGRVVTRWLKGFKDEGGELVDYQVSQSSDNEFHCLSITLFCRDRRKREACGNSSKPTR